MTNFNVKKSLIGIIPLSFLPTSGLICKDATHMVTVDYVSSFYELDYLPNTTSDMIWELAN